MRFRGLVKIRKEAKHKALDLSSCNLRTDTSRHTSKLLHKLNTCHPYLYGPGFKLRFFFPNSLFEQVLGL